MLDEHPDATDKEKERHKRIFKMVGESAVQKTKKSRR